MSLSSSKPERAEEPPKAQEYVKRNDGLLAVPAKVDIWHRRSWSRFAQHVRVRAHCRSSTTSETVLTLPRVQIMAMVGLEVLDLSFNKIEVGGQQDACYNHVNALRCSMAVGSRACAVGTHAMRRVLRTIKHHALDRTLAYT